MPEIKFISKTNGIYKRNYSFTMNVMEERQIFKTGSCTEILVNDIKIYTIYRYIICSNDSDTLVSKMLVITAAIAIQGGQ